MKKKHSLWQIFFVLFVCVCQLVDYEPIYMIDKQNEDQSDHFIVIINWRQARIKLIHVFPYILDIYLILCVGFLWLCHFYKKFWSNYSIVMIRLFSMFVEFLFTIEFDSVWGENDENRNNKSHVFHFLFIFTLIRKSCIVPLLAHLHHYVCVCVCVCLMFIS